MQVFVFSWRDIANPRAGGAERLTFEHMRRWVRVGHQVTLFTSSFPGAPSRDSNAGIEVVRRGTEHTVHLAAQHWYRRQPRPAVAIDEIHGLPFGLVAYSGVPVVALIHEVAREIWHRMYSPPVAVMGRILESLSLRWYGRQRIPFIANSPSTAGDLYALGVAPEHLTIIEPAISCTPLDAPPEKECDPTVIFIGRLVPMKGVEDAIRAFEYIHRRWPTSRLWLVGDGTRPYLDDLLGLRRALHLEDAVQFMGRLSEREKLQRLRRAHLLLHPSRREGWGINVIEANAMGTPAVGYRAPGLRDSIRDGETGLLCASGQVMGLADAACSLISDPARYRAMQQAALRWSRQHSWDAAANRSLRVLQEAACP